MTQKGIDLRKKAEKILLEKGPRVENFLGYNIKELIEELSIYQIELEHQNDEIQQTSEELERLKNKYADLYNNAPTGYITLLPDYTIYESNLKAQQLLGLEKLNPGENRNLKITSFIHPGYQDTFYLKFRDILKLKKTYSFEVRLKNEIKGQPVFLRIECMPVEIEENDATDTHVSSVRCSLSDISREKILKLKNEETEYFFRETLSNISDAVFLTDEKGILRFVCPNTEKIFGYKENEIIAMGHISMILGERIMKHLPENGEERQNIDWTITNKNGVKKKILVNIKKVSIKSGRLLFTCRDITDKQKIEGKLSEINRHYKTLLYTLPDPVILLRGSRISYMNREARKLFNSAGKKTKLLRENIFNFIPPEHHESIQDKLSKVESGGKQSGFEMILATLKGNEKILQVKPARVIFRDNPALQLVLQNITEKKHAERELHGYLTRFRHLSSFSTFLNSCENRYDVMQALCDHVHEVLDKKAYIFTTGFNSSLNAVSIINIAGFRGITEKIKKIHGTDPREIRLFPDYPLPGNVVQDKLIKIEKGIEELCRNRFNEDKCRELNELLKPGDVYSIFLSHENMIKGKLFIVMKEGVSLKYHETIETLAKQAGIAIRRIDAARKLSLSEEKVRSLFNNTTDAIFIHDLKGNIIEVNNVACKRLEYSRDELLKLSPMSFDDKEYAELFPARVEQILQAKKGFLETVHVTRSGKKIPVELNAQVIAYEGQKMILSVARDITRRKKQEKDLHLAKIRAELSEAEAKKHLQELERKNFEITALLEGARAVLEMQDFSDTANKIFNICKDLIGAQAGYVALLSESGDKNELLFLEDGGLPCSIDPNMPMPVRGFRQRAYTTGKGMYCNDFSNSEWMEFLPEGHVQLENVLFVPLKIDDDPVGLLGLSNKKRGFNDHDLYMATAFAEIASIALNNSRTRDELIRSKEQAEESDRLKSAFLANMSHEIRTPMNAIMGFSQLLCNREITEEKRIKFTNIIRGRCDDLLHIVNDILDISRIELGIMDISTSKIQLHELMEEIYTVYSNKLNVLGKTDIEIGLKYDVPICILTDPFRLKQIIGNLLDNAIKFTPRGNISFGYKMIDQNNVEFFVKDSGIGIPEDKKEIIFHRFRQADESHSRVAGGTGLGLAICKSLVAMMNGAISFESELNKGTTFYVSIPTNNCANT